MDPRHDIAVKMMTTSMNGVQSLRITPPYAVQRRLVYGELGAGGGMRGLVSRSTCSTAVHCPARAGYT